MGLFDIFKKDKSEKPKSITIPAIGRGEVDKETAISYLVDNFADQAISLMADASETYNILKDEFIHPWTEDIYAPVTDANIVTGDSFGHGLGSKAERYWFYKKSDLKESLGDNGVFEAIDNALRSNPELNNLTIPDIINMIDEKSLGRVLTNVLKGGSGEVENIKAMEEPFDINPQSVREEAMAMYTAYKINIYNKANPYDRHSIIDEYAALIDMDGNRTEGEGGRYSSHYEMMRIPDYKKMYGQESLIVTFNPIYNLTRDGGFPDRNEVDHKDIRLVTPEEYVTSIEPAFIERAKKKNYYIPDNFYLPDSEYYYYQGNDPVPVIFYPDPNPVYALGSKASEISVRPKPVEPQMSESERKIEEEIDRIHAYVEQKRQERQR